MAVTGTMVHVKSDGIPKLRGYLPLVKQTRMLSFQQLLRSQIRFEEVFFHLLVVIHIDDTLSLLFGGSRLAAPLGAFNENAPPYRRVFSQGQSRLFLVCMYPYPMSLNANLRFAERFTAPKFVMQK